MTQAPLPARWSEIIRALQRNAVRQNATRVWQFASLLLRDLAKTPEFTRLFLAQGELARSSQKAFA
jgi:hypothetical protein